MDKQSQLTPDESKESDSQLQPKKSGPTHSPPIQPSLTEEDMETFSEAIIDQYLKTDDSKEALHCVAEQTAPLCPPCVCQVRCGLDIQV
ncbi:eukaryotic translation initiation factor 4 gamma 1-like protein [Lates japonicus]|uniref:Eukaryotic translation initiation factor 4 gamma 1-like protein n=1 Tax=Lates japonicus TaxID=270547 RepID=A0AAD3MTL3_LATJO|nr:eukaryotic translation initiation factor 4 gamma 1-like protein [Lates japonicus]